MKQIPTKFYYAHLSHAKTCIDLVDTMVCDSNGTLNDLDQNTRVVYKDESLFINTWVGAYQPELFPYGSHPSYIVHHKIVTVHIPRPFSGGLRGDHGQREVGSGGGDEAASIGPLLDAAPSASVDDAETGGVEPAAFIGPGSKADASCDHGVA